LPAAGVAAVFIDDVCAVANLGIRFCVRQREAPAIAFAKRESSTLPLLKSGVVEISSARSLIPEWETAQLMLGDGVSCHAAT
jgi:hypothetical protein